MSEQRQKVLEVKHLKQYFQSGRGKNKLVVRAVDDVSFDIYEGEVFGMVGESGCGKTTTGRSIIKLYDATDGEVFFKGKRIGGGVDRQKQTIKALKDQANREILALQPEKRKLFDVKDEARQKIEGAKYTFEMTKARIAATNEDKLYIAKVKLKDLKKTPENQDKIDKLTAELVTIKQDTVNRITAAKAEFDMTVRDIKTTRQQRLQELKKNAKKDVLSDDDKQTIQAIKDRLKADINEQKAQIKEILKDNAFKGETYETMKKIQMIFQDPISSLNPRMTVREIIAEGLRISGINNPAEIDEKVFNALNIVGLTPEHSFRYPHEFSGGQRQRIGIARALVVNPELLIADEPISALDVSIQAQVINLLRDLRKQLNLTIMFIAHDLSVVKFFSDRIGVMYYGKMVELGNAEDVFHHPLHPYTRSLLSAIPQPDPDFEKTRKRFSYNPMRDHKYTAENQPSFVEFENGHYVLASPDELEELRKTYLNK
jgi:oligopeptide transport system ATP-binding protein